MTDVYNYISGGKWDEEVAGVIKVELPLERVFEYTPSDIEQRLTGLSARSNDFLTSLPTFVCSEVKGKGAKPGKVTVEVKFGRLESVEKEGNRVTATVSVEIDFGDVHFDDLSSAQECLGLARLELYRTHWAVRQGNAREILSQLKKVRGEKDEVDVEIEERDVDVPERQKRILGKASTVTEFLKLLFDADQETNRDVFFRGHNDSSFELTPSVLRKRPNGDWLHYPHEDKLCKELLIAHDEEFQNDEFWFDKLVRMQHYGLPTRMLDISSNPLVALYFACENESNKGNAPAEEGEVVIVRVLSDEIKYYNSDTVSCLANLSNLNFDQKDSIDTSKDIEPFNADDAIKHLHHHIKSEKSFFEPKINPKDMRSVVCVKAKRTNSRIKSQSGAFLLFGLSATLPDAGNEVLKISRITITNKEDILRELDRININATTVYPSIERTAQQLKSLYAVG